MSEPEEEIDMFVKMEPKKRTAQPQQDKPEVKWWTLHELKRPIGTGLSASSKWLSEKGHKTVIAQERKAREEAERIVEALRNELDGKEEKMLAVVQHRLDRDKKRITELEKQLATERKARKEAEKEFVLGRELRLRVVQRRDDHIAELRKQLAEAKVLDDAGEYKGPKKL